MDIVVALGVGVQSDIIANDMHVCSNYYELESMNLHKEGLA